MIIAVVAVLSACSDDTSRRPGAASSRPSTSESTSPPPVARSLAAPSPTGPDVLLPNMTSLPAEDVHIQQTSNGRRLLRFTSVLANSGPGPLVVDTDDSSPQCPRGQRFASQITFVDAAGDGRYQRARDRQRERTPAGCMLNHPTHDHWHFDASASYELTTHGDWRPVVSSDKVSFCLRDSRKLPGAGGPARERYDDCDRSSVQGISTGWGDVYKWDLDGQALPLPNNLPDGSYCLTLTADPFNLWRETDDTDNASVVGVRIRGDDATRVRPTGCRV